MPLDQPTLPISLSSPKPTASQIAATLESQPDSFGFLQDILGEQVPKQALAEVDAKREIEVKARAEHKEEIKLVDETPEDPKVAINDETRKTDEAEPAKAEPVEKPTEEIDPVVAEALSGKQENFRNIRKALGETKTTLKTKEQELAEVTSKLKAYETLEELPEPIKAQLREKDERIEKLSKYESLVALKVSDGYKSKFIKPIEGIKQKLTSIGDEYGIPENIMQEALNLKSGRALNTFLSDNFDMVAATDVKALISQVQDLEKQAEEAEKAPSVAMQSLEAETSQARQLQRAGEIDGIVRQSKSAWAKSLDKIKQEGLILELIPSDNNEEFNNKIVTPIREKAASEYGKIVKALADRGLTHLDDDLGTALAKMVQLAIASSVAIETRSRAQAESEELRANTTRNNKFIRPALGGNVNSSPGMSTAPKSPTDAADMALNAVMGKH